MKPQILITDDDADIQGLLKARLQNAGYQIHLEGSAAGLREALKHREFNTLLLDLNLPDGDGLELIPEVRESDPNLPIIMITAHGSIEKAVEAMRRGAYDFCPKPIDFNRLSVSVNNAIERNQLKRQISSLQKTHKKRLCGLIGASPEMQVVYRIIETVAPTKAPVLITGESGTGKELVAQAVHQLSPRRKKELVDVNCAAIPKDLLESELFGHEKNAFTGANDQYIGRCERADESTLFLDEISEMDPSLQAKLLRFLQDYTFFRVGGRERITVDVRIVSATNRNPQKAIEGNLFREDLYYRLNVVNIDVPALREHASDIPDLAEHFLHHYARQNEKDFQMLSSDAMEILCGYTWPGNVRELENVIQQAVVLHDGEELEAQMLPGHLHTAEKKGPPKPESPKQEPARDAEPAEERDVIIPFEQLEEDAIENALRIMKGNVAKAGAALHLSQATMYRKIRDYNLILKNFKNED
ncbi:response regulator [bacterium]|nr:response regulator [bacterium]